MAAIIIHKDEILPFCSNEHAESDHRYKGWVGSVAQLDAPTKCSFCGARLSWNRLNLATYKMETVSPEAPDWAEAF